MTIAEKVNQSANGTLFTVHKEGLFYKCYNEDALVFVQKVRKYKVSSKFVKATISNLHSIGFPASEVENGKSSFDHLCYLQTWVKYEYPDDTTIIQTNLNSEGIPEANIECELPSKIIYHLSENKKSIVSTEYEYEFDHIHYQKIGWTKEFLSGIITELESHESNASIIDFTLNP